MRLGGSGGFDLGLVFNSRGLRNNGLGSCDRGVHAQLELVLGLGSPEKLLIDLDVVPLDDDKGSSGVGVSLN